MPDKTKPLGICDECGNPIPYGYWYTRKGKARLHCSIDCRNIANSHAGEPIRHAKLMQRIEQGEWKNPVEIHPLSSSEQSDRARKGRLREVAAGNWRNPGLTNAAREINSQPHKHTGPLASAIEKLKHGSVADLTPEERDAHRSYRRKQQAALRASRTPEQISEQRRKWREYYRRKSKKSSPKCPPSS